MRARQVFGQTLREAPNDAQVPSHKLLVRGAFIRPVAAGFFAWLPLGRRVLLKVEQIVREEMDAAGASELLMPVMQPADLWKRSGRWQTAMGGELYKFEDPAGREWCLQPTSEEVVTMLASTELPSYKDLPSIPYQIQWKFRYAPRPRGGLLRGREFLMKDAYSFDVDEDGLLSTYERMREAYMKAFDRCGMSVVQLEAHPGSIGGTINHEFTQPSASGEDTYVSCEGCDYAANTEVASGRPARSYDFGESPAQPEKIHTPGQVTVDEVAAFLDTEPARLAKALLFATEDGQLVCALVPGDRELNEYKLAKALGGGQLTMLKDAEFEKRNIAKGFSGPVGLDARVIADRSLEGARNLITGANEADYHLVGVDVGRDFSPSAFEDLLVAGDGDSCDRCGGKLQISRGVEVGHIFQLGTKYSDSLEARFTDESGKTKPFVMGCYGLGISRTVAAIVEAYHDDGGIHWPRAVAPFQVAILQLTDDAGSIVDDLERELGSRGIDVLVDDRPGVSPGVKFKDADLIGYPLQVVVGKKFLESGKLEAKLRHNGERSDIDPTADAVVTTLDLAP